MGDVSRDARLRCRARFEGSSPDVASLAVPVLARATRDGEGATRCNGLRLWLSVRPCTLFHRLRTTVRVDSCKLARLPGLIRLWTAVAAALFRGSFLRGTPRFERRRRGRARRCRQLTSATCESWEDGEVSRVCRCCSFPSPVAVNLGSFCPYRVFVFQGKNGLYAPFK